MHAFNGYRALHVVKNFHEPIHVTNTDTTIIEGRERAAGEEVNV